MPYRIKVRLMEIGKTQIDLIEALRNKGYTIDPANMSRLLRGIWNTKHAEMLIAAADEIVTEWEKARVGHVK